MKFNVNISVQKTVSADCIVAVEADNVHNACEKAMKYLETKCEEALDGDKTMYTFDVDAKWVDPTYGVECVKPLMTKKLPIAIEICFETVYTTIEGEINTPTITIPDWCPLQTKENKP